MDILNWLYLIKNKFTKTTPAPNDLIMLGSNVGFKKRGDKFQDYAISVNDLATYINESVAGNCPIQMNFKPGSIGEKVSFRKESGTDPATNKDVIIPGELEITRGANGNGIYNIALESSYSPLISPQNTLWNTQYLDAANTSWASLGNIQDRTYDIWREAIQAPDRQSVPPQYVGMPTVMLWDNGVDEPRYWLIMFTEWGVGAYNEYGFAYDRYEILSAVEFSQPSATNTNTPNVIDIISDGVHITRGYQGVQWGGGGAIYNTVTDPYSAPGASPRNTKWNSIYTDSRAGYSGYSDLSNLESRVYTDFVNALDYLVGQNVLDTDLIMHDMTTDLYYKVNFNSWQQGGGNAAYPGSIKTLVIDSLGSGYPDGTFELYGAGGSGEGSIFQIEVVAGVVTNIIIFPLQPPGEYPRGKNYQVGDIITLPYPGVTDPATVEITEVYEIGGFSYTRTVIPQSCGVKFADGTVMNTATTGSSGRVTSGPIATDGTTLYSTGPAAGPNFNTSNGIFLGQNAGQNATGASNSNFFGTNAGINATNAYYSNFIGETAGFEATNARASNFFGKFAGGSATNANNSNFLGSQAGQGATDAYNSNFLGQFAGIGATDANNSNFFGSSSGFNGTTVSDCNFFGSEAGYTSVNSYGSNFFGASAGYSANECLNSNFIGGSAGNSASQGFGSNFIGNSAGASTTGSYYSNFIGYVAGNSASNSINANFIGNETGYGATGASNSNFIGWQAGANADNSQYSNFIGGFAGKNASNCISSNFIGSSAGENANNANNCNFIGNGAGTGSTGDNVIALGLNAATNNTLNGMTVISNSSMPTYADHAAAALAITVALGASAGNTYLYHNQATNSIGAVRL